jgi:HPt (histidine-containing phosphotransfer) domain-containing protein
MSQFDTPIYDKAQALARLDGDESLFKELMDMFVAESESYCQALEAALSSGDAANLRREAHTVKSLLATFSYEVGRELALRLEHLAAGGTLDGAEELTREVIAAVRRLSAVFAAEAA